MDTEKRDRLRLLLQEAFSPIIKNIERLEVEMEALKKGQEEIIKLLKNH